MLFVPHTPFSLQLCDGATPEERAKWQLTAAQDYHYLNQSTCFELPGVNNAEEYKVGSSTGRR